MDTQSGHEEQIGHLLHLGMVAMLKIGFSPKGLERFFWNSGFKYLVLKSDKNICKRQDAWTFFSLQATAVDRCA